MQLNGNLYTTISNLKKFGEDFLLDFDENDSNEFIIIKYMNNAYQLENKTGKRVIIDTNKWNELKHTYKAEPNPEEILASAIEAIKTSSIPVTPIDDVTYIQKKIATSLGIPKELLTGNSTSDTEDDDISVDDLKKIQEEMAGKSDPERKVGRKPGSSKK